MQNKLLTQLQATHQELQPQLKALRTATSAIQRAMKLMRREKPEALAMQHTLGKLQQATKQLDHAGLDATTRTFEEATTTALKNLEFELARDLKNAFEQQGQIVSGRPPTLVVGLLRLQLDSRTRKAQWFYGKDALTRPLSLSPSAILNAYQTQHQAIAHRKINRTSFLLELYQAWQQLIQQRVRRPAGGRINVVEVYSQVVMNRQPRRFWNGPSRQTFKEYFRAHFVRDVVLTTALPTLTIAGKLYRLRLGVATKSQASQPHRAIWLPEPPFGGQYYSDLTFEEVKP